MDTLHKILAAVIAAFVVFCIVLGYFTFKAHDAWKEKDADRRVMQQKLDDLAQLKIKPAETTVTQLQTANTGISSKEQKDLAEVKKRLDAVPSKEETEALIKKYAGVQAVPALDAQGKPVIAIADTPENRAALNKATVDYDTCKIGLFSCQAREENNKAIILQKDTIIAGYKETVDLQADQIKKYKEFGQGGNIWTRVWNVGAPIGCAGLAAYGASTAKASAKATTIATVGGGTLCAITLHH